MRSTRSAREQAGAGAPRAEGGIGGSNLALPVGGKGPSPLPEISLRGAVVGDSIEQVRLAAPTHR